MNARWSIGGTFQFNVVTFVILGQGDVSPHQD